MGMSASAELFFGIRHNEEGEPWEDLPGDIDCWEVESKHGVRLSADGFDGYSVWYVTDDALSFSVDCGEGKSIPLVLPEPSDRTLNTIKAAAKELGIVGEPGWWLTSSFG